MKLWKKPSNPAQSWTGEEQSCSRNKKWTLTKSSGAKRAKVFIISEHSARMGIMDCLKEDELSFYCEFKEEILVYLI